MRLLLTGGPLSIASCLLNEWLTASDAVLLDTACSSKTCQAFLQVCYKQVSWPRGYLIMKGGQSVDLSESFIDMVYWLQTRGITVQDDGHNKWLELNPRFISTLLNEKRALCVPFIKSVVVSNKLFASRPQEVVDVVFNIFPSVERVRLKVSEPFSAGLDLLFILLSSWKLKEVDCFWSCFSRFHNLWGFLPSQGGSLEALMLPSVVHAEDLQLIAASCPALQELHFQDAIILSTDVPSIITFICGLHALKVLSLMMPVEYTLTVKETSMLATQLAQLTSVSIFNLESTNALEFFHCFLSQYPCLRHLDLCHISYDIEGETRLSSLYVGDEIILESDYHINLIVNILRNLPRLDKLLWSNWNDLYGNTTLISAFSSSCTEVLRNVSHCELALESAEQLPTLSILLSMLPNLIDLEISSFQDESETEVFTVACCRTLAEHSPRVRRLLLYLDRDLACGGFSEASMQVLLDGLQDLCSFELLVRCNELIALQSLAVLATSDRVWDYLDFTYTPLKMEDVCISIDQDGLHVKRLGFNHPSMYVGYGHIPITSAQVLNAVSRREVAFSNAIPRKYAAM